MVINSSVKRVCALVSAMALLATPTVRGMTADDYAGVSGHLVPMIETIVIYDDGKTTPISTWVDSDDVYEAREYRGLDGDQMEQAVKAAMNDPATVEASAQAYIDNLFPVRSKKLKQQVLTTRQLLKEIPGLLQPIFIIGSDPWSVEWLMLNHRELLAMGATGVLTEVPDVGTFKQLQRMAAPMELAPLPADFLYDEFQVAFYPVLVTQQGFFQ